MTENVKAELREKLIRYATVLMSMCLASGALLSVVFQLARDRIDENQEKAFKQKLALVMADAENPRGLIEYPETTPLQDRIYVAETAGGVRYAAMGVAQGYQSRIEVLLSLDAPQAGEPVEDAPTIFRVAVVSSGETPGLGENIRKVESKISLWKAIWDRVTGGGGAAKAEENRPAFQEQFSGKRLSELPAENAPDMRKIVPVTGATITSRAVVKAARRAAQRIIEATLQTYGTD